MTKEAGLERKQNPKARGNGEGSIYQDGNKWKGAITYGKKSNGAPKRKYFRADTEREIIKQMKAFNASLHNGTFVEPSNTTVGEWLKQWAELYKKDRISNKNLDSIMYHINEHIIPAIGHIKLQNLSTKMIQEMYNQKHNSGKLDGTGGLSPKTIKHLHETLRMALNKAVSEGYINKNPALECELKYKDNTEKKKFYTADEQARITEVINPENTTELLILTAMQTGLRKGEIIVLTWDDIDFDGLSIKVNKALTIYKNRDKSSSLKYVIEVKEPKTKASRRSVPISEELAGLLRKHRQKILQDNMKAGRSNNEFNLVFQSNNGTYLEQANITRTWNRVLAKAKVDRLGFHGIRHSFATRLAENNIHPKVTQVLMGHSNISTTLDIYSHVSNMLVDSSRETLASLFKLDKKVPSTSSANSSK